MLHDISSMTDGDPRIASTTPDAARGQFPGAGWGKFVADPNSSYSVLTADNALLTQNGTYVHPQLKDVFIRGDIKYGLEMVLSAKKDATAWEFKLLLRQLKEDKMGPDKAFNRAPVP